MEQLLKTPFSNIQLELLKLYSKNTSEEDLIALKSFLARYFAEKATRLIDELWEKKGISSEEISNLSSGHLRKKTSSVN